MVSNKIEERLPSSGGGTGERSKVAIYTRLSEEDRNKRQESDYSESIQNQRSMLLGYAAEHGWVVHDIYDDDDYPGADRNRPQFNRLLADAESRKFDIVLCKVQSRFARDAELVEKYLHRLFPIWNIRFVSIVDNADTSNKGNKKARQITGLVDEWYLEDMSENIRSVLRDRRINGYHIGAFALYGYIKDPDNKGHLLIDEEAAEIVREVFTLFAQGYGKTAIAKILNDRGVPNPTEYKRLKGLRYSQPKGKHSTLWKYYSISDMLVNEIYIGNMVQGKYGSVSYKTKQNKPRPKSDWYRVEGTHEPIIDRDLWERVQSLAAQKAKPFIVGNIGLFARKAFCSNCGYTMRSSKNRGKHYLKCSSRHVAKDACIGSFISVDKLEQTVLSEINALASAFLDQDELAAKMQLVNGLETQQMKLESNLVAYQKKLAEYTKGIKDLYMDKVKGIIPESEFIGLSSDFRSGKERMEALIAETEEQLVALKARAQSDDDRRKIAEQYMNLPKLNREVVETLIDYINVGKKDTKTGELPIEIYWKF